MTVSDVRDLAYADFRYKSLIKYRTKCNMLTVSGLIQHHYVIVLSLYHNHYESIATETNTHRVIRSITRQDKSLTTINQSINQSISFLHADDRFGRITSD